MTDQRTLAAIISTALTAKANCDKSGNTEWAEIWQGVIESAVYELPRGSGFDSYPAIDYDATTVNKLVFVGSYHSMDEHGGYNGWRDYTVYCRPAFEGFVITVRGGGEHNDYIGEAFHEALSTSHDRNAFRSDLKA